MSTQNETILFPETDPAIELAQKDTPVRFSIWWIRCDQREQKHRFLYACIMPAKGRVSTRWASSDSDEASFIDSQGNRSKRRIVRRFLCVPGHQAHELLTNIINGKPLAEASAAAKVDSPDINADMPLLTDDKWTRLMPFFFPEDDSLTFLFPFAKGRQSPAGDTGCYCTRLCPTNRFGFLKDEGESDELLIWAASVLQKETGIDFNKSAGDAFRNIEIFGFPSLDAQNQPLLTFRFMKDHENTFNTISLKLSVISEKDEYFAQVRSELIQDISSDQLVMFNTDTGEVSVKIPAPTDGFQIRIWKKQSSGRRLLWFEKTIHLVREISITGHVIGLTGSIGANWLDRLEGTKASSRAKAFEKIAQVHMDIPMMMSTRASWEKDIQKDRRAIRRIHPEKSEARFFSKGWEGDTKLDFAEWLKKVLSKHGGRILLIDPYFDEAGVDLVARASGLAKEIAVLTCTQTPSEDDENTTGTRAKRLENALNNLLPIFQGLKLRILDLKSKQGGKRRLFHDRYILLFKTDESIEKGFNLSTSLQSATRTTPLLVTPIPEDILDEVADYVTRLLQPDVSDNNAEVITIFSPQRERHASLSEISPSKAHSIVRFIEVLQSRSDLRDAGDYNTLCKLGYLDEETMKVHVPCDAEQLKTIKRYLVSAPLSEASLVWEGLVETLLSEWYDSLPALLTEICSDKEIASDDFLCRYLVGHANGDIQAENAEEHTRTLAHLFDDTSFLKSLEKASNLFNYHHEFPLGTSWPIHAATLCISTYYPSSIDPLVNELYGLGDKSHAALSALATGLWNIVRKSDVSCLSELSKSNIDFVRALSAVAEWYNLQEGRITQEIFEKDLERYVLRERQEILARALFDLRVKANQSGSKDPQADIPLYSKVIELLVSNLMEEISTDRILELLPSFSGPLNGSWAVSTHNDILDPLVKADRLEESEIFIAWDETLNKEVVNDAYFSERDIELVEVWGATFKFATDERREQVLDQAKKEIERSERTLCDPFLHKRDYNKWRKSADGVLLWMIRLWAILENCKEEANSEIVGLAEETIRIIREETLVESALPDMKKISKVVINRLIPLLNECPGMEDSMMDYLDKHFQQSNVSKTGEYSRDGAISEEKWSITNPRILYVLKETVGYSGTGANLKGWHIREEIERDGGWLNSGKQAITYRKIAKLSWLLRLALEKGSPLSVEEANQLGMDRLDLLREISNSAIINISKHSSSTKQSAYRHILEQGYKNKDIIRRQIDDLKPNIIIAGSSVVWRCLENKEWGICRDIIDSPLGRHQCKRFSDIVFYHANHPSAWTGGGFNPIDIHQRIASLIRDERNRP